MSDLAKIRKKAGWSRDRAAVEARVAYATCRLFEASPEAVQDLEARGRLEAVYQQLRAIAEGERAA